MSTQGQAPRVARLSQSERGRGSNPESPELAARERAVLRLISEQHAIPLDQLARFLGISASASAALVSALEQRGWVEQAVLISGQPPWACLTSRSGRLTKGAYRNRLPAVRVLTHLRAINEVRLHLEQRAPCGRWVCERALKRDLSADTAIPDGVFEIDGERHAIEVELSRKHKHAVEASIAAHSDRYDAVIYFCGPDTRSLLDEIYAGAGWPRLLVRSMPGPTAPYRRRSHGFGFGLRDPRPELPPPGSRRRGKRRSVAPWEQRVLRLISEQGAMPVDLLGRFVGYGQAEGERLARHLAAGRLANLASLLADEPDWIWLNHRGSQASGSGLAPVLPRPGGLAKRRALAAIRLRVEAADPSARWTGRRQLLRQLSGVGMIPDAVVEAGGERHAIELQIRQRRREEALSMLAHRAFHYDAVVCFCSPPNYKLYANLLKERSWPKLRVQRLPVSSSLPSLPPSRWAGSLNLELFQRGVELSDQAAPRYRRRNSWQSDEDPQRSEVSDELWAKIKKLLPGDQRRGAAAHSRRTPDRAALSGVIYIARRGCGRDNLPTELGYGAGGSCFRRLRAWEADGVWPAVRALLDAELPGGEQIAWRTVERWR